MLGTFILVICLVLAILLWVFVRQERRQRRQSAAARPPTLIQTQRRVLTPSTHMTGESYGRLLRAAQGDRQQVELWIVEAQCNMPGYTRSEIIELLARER